MTSSDIATMTGPPPATASDFTALSRRIRAAGLLERRRGYYIARITLNLIALAAGWGAFVFLGATWWTLAVAAFLAVMFTQLSFIGHDAGHKQIFRTKRANDITGLAHGALVGLSYGWWVNKHNKHHANPNHEEDDPDLDIGPLAFTVADAEAKRGFVRWTVRNQAYLFFPLLLLEGLNLHMSSAQAVWSGEVKSARRTEKALLIGHAVVYLAAVFLVLPPLMGLAFIAVHQGLWGVYMGCSFAPNHKGMPTVPAGQTLDFLRKQVLTSRNVRGGVVTDIALGGLNYQIEHHLFPNMPSPNLRHAQAIVRDHCAEHGIEYAQCGLFASYGHVLRHLHEVGAPLRSSTT
ncbi:fatty acid desaturase family protein [Actinokineospora iranica]|uniref:Fatty acid desaturase n=1 Tax=Actinokineospora iranica TaxID=1271860 RepID=A0A1G6VC03_9PSEU|nr:acyl-CoA desaturase [Actinokineospora iranica]SDD51179.1 Fatty acid desaturase [Actinokineospora iranica]